MVCGYYLYIFSPIECQPVYKCILYKCQVDYALLDPPFLGRFASQGSKDEALRFQFVKQVSRLCFYYSLRSFLYYIVCVKVPQDYYLTFYYIDSILQESLYSYLGSIITQVINVNYTNLAPICSYLYFSYIRANRLVALRLYTNVLTNQEARAGSRVWFVQDVVRFRLVYLLGLLIIYQFLQGYYLVFFQVKAIKQGARYSVV